MKVKELAELPFDEFVKFVDEQVSTPNEHNKKGISISFPYDLRESLEMKSKNCSIWHKWTAFLNNAGTLCHVIGADAEILVRLKFSYPIKHLSTTKQLEMIKGRLRNWVVL